MCEWRDIETAPKDGTKVDLWLIDEKGNGWRIPDAFWGYDGWAYEDNQFRYCEYEYKGTGDQIRDRARFARATHWMPIPKGPS